MFFFSSSESGKNGETIESEGGNDVDNSWERPEGQPDFFATIYEDSAFISALLLGWVLTQVLGNYLLLTINMSVRSLRVSKKSKHP